jgi:hypothetical protein
VQIDRTAPGKASIDLAAKSDHGRSSTDNRTNDSTPTLTGTAERHATVTIRDGHHVLGTVTVNAAGQWHFTSDALSEGKHSLTATATDIAGNHGKASSALHLLIDTTAPVPRDRSRPRLG